MLDLNGYRVFQIKNAGLLGKVWFRREEKIRTGSECEKCINSRLCEEL